jgi:hypothetical protein
MAKNTEMMGISVISVIGYFAILLNGDPSDLACVGLWRFCDYVKGRLLGLSSALQPLVG